MTGVRNANGHQSRNIPRNHNRKSRRLTGDNGGKDIVHVGPVTLSGTNSRANHWVSVMEKKLGHNDSLNSVKNCGDNAIIEAPINEEVMQNDSLAIVCVPLTM